MHKTANYDLSGATRGYSRAIFIHFTERECQEHWVEGLEEAFEYFVGVLREVLFDNAKAIIIERDAYGEQHYRWNAALLAIAKSPTLRPKHVDITAQKRRGKLNASMLT
ncbi:hypothetical protein L4D06_01110 [Enterovibrio makurazakiensis]|uniref:hypothetical protein n=1 Tax=Enterovibrio makurazakiensis TaxID=2910232 RepID=UPI003D23F36E